MDSESRSEQLADDMMFEDANSIQDDKSSTKRKKKADDLSLRSYYFDGIENLSQAQLAKLDRLSRTRDNLLAQLNKLNPVAPEAPTIKPELTQEQILANQQLRMSKVDITKFVKAGWVLEDSGHIYAGIWNPANPTEGSIAVWVEGLLPSKKAPNRTNLKQILSGEQAPSTWLKGLADFFTSLPHASEDQWESLTRTYLSGEKILRKDKPPKSPKKKPAKQS